MKETTGEVSMTVVTIVLIAILLGIAYGLFKDDDSIGRKWINDTFSNITKGDVDYKTVK